MACSERSHSNVYMDSSANDRPLEAVPVRLWRFEFLDLVKLVSAYLVITLVTI